jgi:hypothetical protein
MMKLSNFSPTLACFICSSLELETEQTVDYVVAGTHQVEQVELRLNVKNKKIRRKRTAIYW